MGWRGEGKGKERMMCMLTVEANSTVLMAQQPHARCLQFVASRQSIPCEVTSAIADGVHFTSCTVLVPESTAVEHCAVVRILVVVTVVRGEHLAVVVTERVSASVTRVPGHVKRVVGSFGLHHEHAVLGVVPVAICARLKVKSELVAAAQCQLTELFVAEPVVASRIVKSDLKFFPRTVEEVGAVEILLD